jgi:transcriptional regulator with XRE-family HTH domain
MEKALDLLRRRLRALLDERQMSQTDFAHAAGLKDAWVSGILRGKHDTPVSKLDKVARALSVEVVDLFIDRTPATERLALSADTIPDDPQTRAEFAEAAIAHYEEASRAILALALASVSREARTPAPPSSRGGDVHSPVRRVAAGRVPRRHSR